MVMKKSQKPNGFTLIEVLLASFIFVVTVGAITVLFITSSNVQTQSKTIRDINQSGRYALEAIARDIKASYSTYYTTTDPEVDANSNNLGKLKVPAFISDGSYLVVRTSVTTCNKYSLEVADVEKKINVLRVQSGILINSAPGHSWAVTDCQTPEDSLPVTDTSQVSIKNITFSGVDPKDDNAQQPFVKITMTVESPQYETTTKAAEKAIQTLETTVVSSSYPLGSSQ